MSSDLDSEDESEVSVGEAAVQLGFLEDYRGHLDSDRWGDWDGGKVGGRPAWLERSAHPRASLLRCGGCADPMSFLLQVYCPLDIPPDAFHRSLYVFCCRKPECFDAGSVRCLRSQLPKANAHYSADPDLLPESGVPLIRLKLCMVCGCAADSVCSKCKTAHYCSRSHQREDWRRHKSFCGQGREDGSVGAKSGASIFPEFAIVVEEEELKDTVEDEQIARAVANANIWDDAMAEPADEADEDAKLRQSDYSKALGNEVVDPAYVHFMTRVRRGGDKQVLRYCRWEEEAKGGGPLHMHSERAVVERRGLRLPTRVSHQGIPPCPYCQGERKFEFQVRTNAI